MKKILAITLTALMLTALLCGCGMSSDANGTVYDGTGVDDGFVNDRDGFIEDHDSTAYPAPTPGSTNGDDSVDSYEGGNTGSSYGNGAASSGSGSNGNSSANAGGSGNSGTDDTGKTGSAAATPQPSPQASSQAK